MKKAVKAILNVLSYGGIEVESARRLADIKKLDPIRIFLRKLDMEIYNGDYKVPIRLFFPDEKMEEHGAKEAILFFHGGGWVVESVDTYNHVCRLDNRECGDIRPCLRTHGAVDGADCCIGRIPSCTGASFPDRLRRLLRRRPGNAARGDSAGGNAGKCHDHGRQRRRKSCGCGLPDGEG